MAAAHGESDTTNTKAQPIIPDRGWAFGRRLWPRKACRRLSRVGSPQSLTTAALDLRLLFSPRCAIWSNHRADFNFISN